MQAQYTIPEQNLAQLEDKLQKLNKKAKKLGKPEISFRTIACKKVKRSDEFGLVSWFDVYHIVEIDGTEPIAEGSWEFLATIQHDKAGNVVRKVPGCDEINTKDYRHAPSHCEHCQKQRRRKDTYLVKSGSGQIKQIGKTCIKDFLGHGDPHAIASWLELFIQLNQMFSDAEEMERGGGYRETHYNLQEYLAFVSEAVRQFGWMSRTQAAKDMFERHLSTADVVAANFNDLRSHKAEIRKKAFLPSDESTAEAAAALVWGKQQFVEVDPDTLNDYQFNLRVAISDEDGSLLIRNCGIAASLIAAYKKAMEHENLRKIEQVCNEYLGEVGKKIEGVKCTLVSVRTFEDDWGDRHLHKFKTTDGHILTWWTSSDPWEEGQEYVIKAGVKAHEDYKGTKQTVLTRVSEFVPKSAKAKKSAKATLAV